MSSTCTGQTLRSGVSRAISEVLFRPTTMRTLLTLALLALALPTGRPQALSGVPADDGFDSAPAAKRGGRIEIKYCMS